jgi:hypothetical protein
MRLKIKIVLTLALLGFAAGAHAQSSREQLKNMVEQLQKSPSDNALREKIIKLAQELKPAPAVPEEAQRREGRAKFAFKDAKSNEDFLVAAKEYEEAARIAPWIAGYYSDLCTIYEKARNFAVAKRNCEFALAGSSDPSQVSEIRQRIAGLEFGMEKASSPRGRAEAMLAVLLKKYGGPAQRLLICGVNSNKYWLCSDAEAQGSNWVDAMNVNAMPKPGPNPIVFKMAGEDQIKMMLGSSLFPGQAMTEDSGFRGACAKPNGEDPNAMTWVQCPGWGNAGSPRQDVKVLFSTTKDGAPLVEYRDSCGGSEFPNSCRRAQFVLQSRP